ncbi:hypothetical protein BMS3Bbin02_00165 [bacterium BMS3Bbin02]|nr:hypothetical protein BMS3Bbin02_00165 [bacterium BMS3Bbin02]
MLFWHLGASVAVARYTFRDEKMDLRFLAFGALLPDIVDTPIGLLMWDSFQSVRLVAHSLLAAVAIMVLVLIRTRRGRPRRRWMAVAVGMLLHLFLDAMWDSQQTLLWPFLGTEFSGQTYDTVGGYISSVIANPLVWGLEALGLIYLVVLGRRGGLIDRSARKNLLSTGVIEVPIPER